MWGVVKTVDKGTDLRVRFGPGTTGVGGLGLAVFARRYWLFRSFWAFRLGTGHSQLFSPCLEGVVVTVMTQPTRRAMLEPDSGVNPVQALFRLKCSCFFPSALLALAVGAGTPPGGSTRVTEPSK